MKTPCIDHGRSGNSDGYTSIRIGDERPKLHRYVYEQAYGFMPEVVMHKCDNPRCININHLEAGTWDSNNKDRAAKGRSAKHRGDLRVLSDDDVRTIRRRYSPVYCKVNGVSALSREFSVDTNVIYNIVKRKTYTNVN